MASEKFRKWAICEVSVTPSRMRAKMRNSVVSRAAALAGTIPYELMCDVNPRVPRVYLRNGQRV